MHKLGTLIGAGYLVWGSRREAAAYRLTVLQDKGSKWAEGTIEGSIEALDEAMRQASLTLELSNGTTCGIVIVEFSPGHPARVKSSGPVPGY